MCVECVRELGAGGVGVFLTQERDPVFWVWGRVSRAARKRTPEAKTAHLPQEVVLVVPDGDVLILGRVEMISMSPRTLNSRRSGTY